MEMMKWIYGLCLCLLLPAASAWAQGELDCSDLKTGYFHYESPGGGTVYVKRDEAKQYEWSVDGTVYMELDIKWISDCAYSITFVKLEDDSAPDELKELVLGKSFDARITEADGEKYHYVMDIFGKSEEADMSIMKKSDGKKSFKKMMKARAKRAKEAAKAAKEKAKG